MKYDGGWWIPDADGYADQRHPVKSQERDVGVIDLAMTWVRKHRVVVQAGARVGLFPSLLSWRFDEVIAFEPDADNFECCRLNCLNRGKRVGAIAPSMAALGSAIGLLPLVRSPQSSGEHYVAATGRDSDQRVAVCTIDSLLLPALDAVFLDVEGYELEVLKGARETIERCKPVIVVEENALCKRYGRKRGDVKKWLAPLGYVLTAEFGILPPELQNDGYFRGSDLVFVP